MRRWGSPLAVFVALFAVYALTVSTHSVNTDVAANATTAWRIAHTGQPWMDGLDLREAGEVPHYAKSANGHMVTTRSPGQIWLATPFYLGSSEEQRQLGWTRAGLAAAFATAVAMPAFFGALRRRLGDGAGLAATAVLALSTPVWSVSADALWTHPVTVLGLCGAAWALDRERWWLAGCLFAIGIVARAHIALIAAVVGLLLAWRRRSPTIAIKVGLASGAGIALLLAWNRIVFEAWSLKSGYGVSTETFARADQQRWMDLLVNSVGFLVAPNRGLLLWSPLLLLLLPFVRRGWQQSPEWVRAMAAGGLVYALAQVRINGFGGDAFWGYRHGLELLACVAPLLVYTVRAMPQRPRSFIPLVVAVQFAIIALGAVFEPFALLVPDEQQWTHHALVVAAQTYPQVTIACLVLFFAVGLYAARRASQVLSRSSEPATATQRA